MLLSHIVYSHYETISSISASSRQLQPDAIETLDDGGDDGVDRTLYGCSSVFSCVHSLAVFGQPDRMDWGETVGGDSQVGALGL